MEAEEEAEEVGRHKGELDTIQATTEAEAGEEAEGLVAEMVEGGVIAEMVTLDLGLEQVELDMDTPVPTMLEGEGVVEGSVLRITRKAQLV